MFKFYLSIPLSLLLFFTFLHFCPFVPHFYVRQIHQVQQQSLSKHTCDKDWKQLVCRTKLTSFKGLLFAIQCSSHDCWLWTWRTQIMRKLLFRPMGNLLSLLASHRNINATIQTLTMWAKLEVLRSWSHKPRPKVCQGSCWSCHQLASGTESPSFKEKLYHLRKNYPY